MLILVRLIIKISVFLFYILFVFRTVFVINLYNIYKQLVVIFCKLL